MKNENIRKYDEELSVKEYVEWARGEEKCLLTDYYQLKHRSTKIENVWGCNDEAFRGSMHAITNELTAMAQCLLMLAHNIFTLEELNENASLTTVDVIDELIKSLRESVTIVQYGMITVLDNLLDEYKSNED